MPCHDIPARLFHGTASDFLKFQDGITWFTPNREETILQYRSNFAKPWHIFRVSFRANRLADLGDPRMQSILSGAGFASDQVGQISECTREIVPLMERHGYDGLCAWMGDVHHYAAFHPEQFTIESRETIPAER